MVIHEKIKAIREAEGLTQVQFAELLGVSLSAIKQIDSGQKKNPHAETLLKITTHRNFEKYTLWLMTGQVAPESGQISPDLKATQTRLKTGS